MSRKIEDVVTNRVINALATISEMVRVAGKTFDKWQKNPRKPHDAKSKALRYSVDNSNLKVWATPEEAGRYNRYLRALTDATREFQEDNGRPWDPEKDLLPLEGIAAGDEVVYDRLIDRLEREVEMLVLNKVDVDFNTCHLTPPS